MQFKPLLGTCILGLASFALAAPSSGSNSKLPTDVYMDKIMPVQLARIYDFRSYFSDLTPEQEKYLDKLAYKIRHMNFKNLHEIQAEGEEVLKEKGPKPTGKPKRGDNGRTNSPRDFKVLFSPIRDIFVHYQ
ncbi:hypothetical protein CIHG_10324 [Coccidioides immitis H538.4]|uniref:Uncharacterized protein n=1 Tax=Coccidioides immitis H538.4 TaxID=396776 RepID=A0A0J8S7X4_COCIT|nr:hypothetical protein CIHG_10324 [Coccidioides immitis H538.4]